MGDMQVIERGRYALGPGFRRVFADLGMSEAEACSLAGIPLEPFESLTAWLDLDQVCRLYRAYEQMWDDGPLPVAIAGVYLRGRLTRLEPQHLEFEPPIFATHFAPDLATVHERLGRYERLVSPVVRWVDETRDTTTIGLRWGDDDAAPTGLALTEMLLMIAHIRSVTGEPVSPLRITTAHPPAEQDAYRAFAGVGIDAAPEHSITWRKADARRPFPNANEQMWKLFKPELDRLLAEFDAASPTRDATREVLDELLPRHEGSLANVARELGVSGRTLQRRLDAEGTNFREVLTETRESLAKRYLATTELSLREVARRLGYGDTRSLTRAIREWSEHGPLPPALERHVRSHSRAS